MYVYVSNQHLIHMYILVRVRTDTTTYADNDMNLTPCVHPKSEQIFMTGKSSK